MSWLLPTPLLLFASVGTLLGGHPVAVGANYQRLVEIKRTYNPDNIFRHNANIRP